MGAGPEIGPTDPTGRSSGRCKTCTPCRGGIPPLTREQAELFHAAAPDWQLTEEAHRIERSFRFRNFRRRICPAIRHRMNSTMTHFLSENSARTAPAIEQAAGALKRFKRI